MKVKHECFQPGHSEKEGAGDGRDAGADRAASCLLRLAKQHAALRQTGRHVLPQRAQCPCTGLLLQSKQSPSIIHLQGVTFKLSSNLVTSKQEAAEIRVKIARVTENFQVSSNDVAKAVNIRPDQADKGILEVYNLLISQKPFNELVHAIP